MTVVTAQLPGTARSAREARKLVRRALGEKHPSTSDAELVVSELVSNAVNHSRSGLPGGQLTVAVELSAESPDVLIRVNDAGADEHPKLARAGPDSEHGRGLGIVQALAAEWATEADESGRATWCRLTPPA